MGKHRRRATALLLIMAFGLLVLWCGAKRDLYMKGFVAEFSNIPVNHVVERLTSSGLRVHVPALGNECWNAELPCTPNFNKELELRGATLESGFRMSTK